MSADSRDRFRTLLTAEEARAIIQQIEEAKDLGILLAVMDVIKWLHRDREVPPPQSLATEPAARTPPAGELARGPKLRLDPTLLAGPQA